jgi:hypothetical protein
VSTKRARDWKDRNYVELLPGAMEKDRREIRRSMMVTIFKIRK